MATRRVDIRINVDDLDAGKRLDDIAAKLDKLSKGTYTIKLRLDDGGTSAKLDKISEKLDKIGHNTYTPKIGMDGITKADGELDKLDARLDKIGHKRVTATVHVRTTGGKGIGGDLAGLFGGGGGSGGGNIEKDAAEAAGAGGGGGAGGFLSFLGGANNSYMGILIGALGRARSVNYPCDSAARHRRWRRPGRRSRGREAGSDRGLRRSRLTVRRLRRRRPHCKARVATRHPIVSR